MSEKSLPRVVRGGGFTLHTADPVVIALVVRIAQLEAELAEARRRASVADSRTLRRDVSRIARTVGRLERRLP